MCDGQRGQMGLVEIRSRAGALAARSVFACRRGARSRPGQGRVMFDTESPGNGVPGVTVGQAVFVCRRECFISPLFCFF